MNARSTSSPPQRVRWARLPEAFPAPTLGPWSRVWRYLLALSVGALFWIFTVADYTGQNGEQASDVEIGILGVFILLDLALGIVSLGILPLRRRRPMVTALVTTILSTASVFSVGPAILAIVSMSTRRRWRPVVVVGAVWLICSMTYEFLVRPAVPGGTFDPLLGWATGAISAAVYAICVSTGFYIGARRDLLTSLRERALNAEREQALREESARESERTRIAREMHDVLAHHISLVSLHAGALSYRTDLTRDETSEAAAVIQNNAQLALTELRQILGVLRSPESGPSGAQRRVEPPQPTLSELPALVADSREAGMTVTCDIAAAEIGTLPEGLSRTAYRIIQEALTNARKHAQGEAVRVVVAKRGDELVVEVVNRRHAASATRVGVSAAASVTAAITTRVFGSGMGLTGLEERAALAGGTLSHGVDADDRFVVTASLPWR